MKRWFRRYNLSAGSAGYGAAMVLVLALLLLAGGVTPAAAATTPEPPHQFYGNVYIGGSLAAASTKIEARVNNVKQVETTVDSSHRYGYSPLFKVPGSTGPVTFYIVGTTSKAVETVAWQSGSINRDDGQPLLLHFTGLTVVTNPATNVTATTATLNGSITSWNPADTSATVWFMWGTAAGGPYTTVAATQVSRTGNGNFTYPLTGLTTATKTYYVKARAVGTTSGQILGSEVNFPSPPDAPIRSSVHTLKWNAVTGATKYHLYVATSPNFAGGTYSFYGPVGNVLYKELPLYAGVTYYWRLRAGNAAGYGGYSTTGSILIR